MRLLSLSLLILVAGVTAAVAAAEDAVWTLPEVTVEGVAPPADGGAGNAAAWARPGPPPLFVAAQGAVSHY